MPRLSSSERAGDPTVRRFGARLNICSPQSPSLKSPNMNAPDGTLTERERARFSAPRRRARPRSAQCATRCALGRPARCCRSSASASRAARFRASSCRPSAGWGCSARASQGYGCAGLNAVSYGLICRELERGDSALRSFVSVQSSLCMYPICSLRQRGAETALAAAHGARRGHRLLRSHRVAGRLRSGEHAHHGAPHGRRTGYSTARRCGSPTAPSPTWPSSGRRPPRASRGFLVERGTRGFSAQEIKHKFSLRASSTGALFFDEVRLPAASRAAVGLGPQSAAVLPVARALWHLLGASSGPRRPAWPRRSPMPGSGCCSAARSSHTQAVQIRLAEMVRALATAQLLALQLGRLEERRRARARPRSRSANGTTAARRSTSRATAGTCSAGPASASSTWPSATCSTSRP